MKRFLFALLLAFVFSGFAFCQNFPTSLDTTTTFPRFDEYKQTYLTGTISSGATTASTGSVSSWSSESYVVKIDAELCLATKASSSTLTLVRGIFGTTARAHPATSKIYVYWSGYIWNAARSGLINVETKLGTGSTTPTTAGDILCVTALGEATWESPATCGISGGGGGGSVATDTIFTTKGDLAVGTGSHTAARLGAGANDTFLIADSAQTTGLKWGNAATARTALGLGTLATQSGTFSGTSSGTNTGDQTTVSGNAGTATALAADPADCAANRFANAINASGTLSCAQVDVSTSAVTGIMGAGNGGTGNGFFAVSGPTTSTKTFTLPDASDTLAALGQSQTFTGSNIFNNASGIKIKDTDASNTLGIVGGSNLTADRTLTLTTGDASRTITLNGDTTLSGTNTGDQTITLTGDVTGSGTGSFAATIANSAVTLAKMANVPTSTVFYRTTAGSGAPEVQILATLKTDLGLTGTNSGDQTITLTGDVTGSGTGSFAATIGANKVTTTTINANAATLAKLDASNATANKMLLSGASASPTWSTSTIPSSAGATANKVLLSDGTNYVLSTPTFPNASAASGKYIKSDGTNWTASTGSASGTGSCTNQVVTATNSDAAPTCASVTNAMLGSGSYAVTTFVATCSGTATSSSTLFLFPIGQISALTCTITAATSGIPMPTAGTIKNLTFKSGTAGKAGDAVTILKNASVTGMPTCIYGAATTCTDTSTSGSVAAGDLITVKIVTTTTDTTANVHVTFQLWN